MNTSCWTTTKTVYFSISQGLFRIAYLSSCKLFDLQPNPAFNCHLSFYTCLSILQISFWFLLHVGPLVQSSLSLSSKALLDNFSDSGHYQGLHFSHISMTNYDLFMYRVRMPTLLPIGITRFLGLPDYCLSFWKMGSFWKRILAVWPP